MNRRELIKAFAATASLTVAGRVWAAPSTDARLLVVFLRGAYDAANVVVPTGSDFYYASRPTLAIARPDAGNPNAALALNSDWGLHPALRDSLYPLWAKREIAFIPFAGPSDDTSRSHFETQDTIELGQAVGGSRDYRSGFMSRLAAELTRVKPIAFTDQLPLTFRGKAQIPNVGINAVGKPAIDDRQAKLIKQMYAHSDLASAVEEGFKVRDDVYRSISEEMTAANRGAVSPRGFELSARRIGRLMREQYNLGFVDVGGWDTHVNQGAAQGYLADRLGELGRALAGFAEEVGPAWRDTVVVTISEFGRTFRENGDRGTDHGHGSAYWVLGGGINGGRILGAQVKVEQANLFQNRDYPVLTDYRSLFAGLLQRMYGLQTASLERIFASTRPADLGIV
ncbi:MULTISPECIES: DUF1501 domain-containing protein [Bradyrhizobium]|uniref:Uncharacterized conserved protein, DUF1501 family n=2 Tax=Bradyrhizobium TaxID=374 RepID=A0ABY0QF21_9BRAD|nr:MULTISPECIES: DUF1501 domain-containing protein [Bradyrhizobium]SDK11968.1 Uncharacterized conserved protein, DUF1501 family [Bradyrhizobium ottawaense]SEE77989.1 Uncharacterized conserved protein, DUF1501 family [Bradyrhizobium lablabi]SHM53193.1 Uncharacterized conserved protein, DUF1501 family [Bradyrhizobium lablabi]